jgi:hypothetical protein
MAKIQESTSESIVLLDVDLDSSVNVEILKDTEHLKKGDLHSVSYAIALIFVKQKIAKIIK